MMLVSIYTRVGGVVGRAGGLGSPRGSLPSGSSTYVG